jgi:hypothetical protein
VARCCRNCACSLTPAPLVLPITRPLLATKQCRCRDHCTDGASISIAAE